MHVLSKFLKRGLFAGRPSTGFVNAATATAQSQLIVRMRSMAASVLARRQMQLAQISMAAESLQEFFF